jgi:hypothetical protein
MKLYLIITMMQFPACLSSRWVSDGYGSAPAKSGAPGQVSFPPKLSTFIANEGD